MPWPTMRLCDLPGLDVPIVQSPMSGSCTPPLAAAVANAGGLRSLGLSGYSAEEVAERCSAARTATNGWLSFSSLVHYPAP